MTTGESFVRAYHSHAIQRKALTDKLIQANKNCDEEYYRVRNEPGQCSFDTLYKLESVRDSVEEEIWQFDEESKRWKR